MAAGSNDRMVVLLCLFMVVAAASLVLPENQIQGVKQSGQDAKHDDIAGPPALKARAEDLARTLVTPHLEARLEPGKNVLWCSTFQLAWNELCDLAGGDLQLAGSPEIAAILNAQEASRKDLDEESFVAAAGIAGEGVLAEIARELEEKFEGAASPELLPPPGSLPAGAWIAYAYLFKNLPFETAFTRFDQPFDFGGEMVAGFGIEQYMTAQTDEVRMAKQVVILDYASNDDFIIELKTKSAADRLILAKIPPAPTIEETIRRVQPRIEKPEPSEPETAHAPAGPQTLAAMETLEVPVLNFDIVREYRELYGRPIASPNAKIDGTEIGAALQSIRFKLDETGAVLKSEAVMALGMSRRRFVFDKPFLILLTLRGAANPYLALWVDNAELLVKPAAAGREPAGAPEPAGER